MVQWLNLMFQDKWTLFALMNVRKTPLCPYTNWIGPIPIEYIKKCFQEPVPLLSDPLTWKTIQILIIESVREHLVKELMNSLLCREQLLRCGTNIHLRGEEENGNWVISLNRETLRGPRGKLLNVKCVCYHWKVKRKCIASCLMKLNLQKIPIQKAEFFTIRQIW